MPTLVPRGQWRVPLLSISLTRLICKTDKILRFYRFDGQDLYLGSYKYNREVFLMKEESL